MTVAVLSQAEESALLPLELSNSSDSAFFGAFAHKVEAAYMAWAQDRFGPGVITSQADGAVLGDRVADRASITELLAVRAETLH
ncbi:hypothetical protein [Amycolatopsis sp.]|uniref:hypothetical protein n=1 Tax=Amycolatopsis sp. TaxID=37632 RepID=UPI002D7EB7B6|nr:hypothetical protein [Amycolatopsis sp.]HET6704414.1 hypothetical protein [Amycolatopsis sp.]